MTSTPAVPLIVSFPEVPVFVAGDPRHETPPAWAGNARTATTAPMSAADPNSATSL